LSGAPGCVTWELILDGYSESSYSATPRFAAARLPWFNIGFTVPPAGSQNTMAQEQKIKK
ncbi:hypothetical protein, partial [Escherichia coli]|uniref:hypothetical protein n=1 Tax=Escherichia coli TaxID=562 RepID=UPI002446C9FC